MQNRNSSLECGSRPGKEMMATSSQMDGRTNTGSLNSIRSFNFATMTQEEASQTASLCVASTDRCGQHVLSIYCPYSSEIRYMEWKRATQAKAWKVQLVSRISGLIEVVENATGA